MSSNRTASTRYTPATMEAFEPRLMLAGNVLAEITSSGDLIITGDDLANSIHITEVTGVVTITRGDANTVINGDDDLDGGGVVLANTFTRNVKIKMGDGDDEVKILGDLGDDDAIGGAGADADTPFGIAGNVQIDLGAGTTEDPETAQDAYLHLVDVAGSVKITSKDDNDADAEILNSIVGKNVQMSLGGGNNEAIVDSVDIGGNLKIQNKDGDQNVLLYSSTVDGSVSIANGKGLHTVDVDDNMIGKNLSIKNKELVAVNPADVQEIWVYNTDVVGSVKISNGKGATMIDIDDDDDGGQNGDSVTIGKKLSITTKDGDDEIYVWDTTAASIKINTGKGAEGGAGTTSVNVADVTTTGSLSVANKSGKTNIEVDDTTVGKKTKLTGGKAETSVDIVDLVATGGLQIKGGGKEVADTLTVTAIVLVSSKVKIKGGAAINTINLDDVTLDSLQIKTGKGNDLINIETVDTAADITSTMETLRIDAAGGVDVITIGDAGSADRGLTLTGKGVINGGKGTDTLDAAAARGNTFGVDMLTVKSIEAGDSVVV